MTTPNFGGQNMPSNQNSSNSVLEPEDDDDLFFGADIEDTKASQPESPRFSDFDIEMDTTEIMPEDSPVRMKSGEVSTGTPVLRRSGSLNRSTSSPSLVQTTPTKTSTNPQLFQLQGQKSVPFNMPTPISNNANSGPGGQNNQVHQDDNPFVSKQTSLTTAAATKSMSSSSSSILSTPPSSSPRNNVTYHATTSPSSINTRHSQNPQQQQQQQRTGSSTKTQGTMSALKTPAANGNRNVFLANSMASSPSAASPPSPSASSYGALSSFKFSKAAPGQKTATTTPSANQHDIQFSKVAQGTGLKRPLGMIVK
ncbi:hypothetical protein BCR41DRAFT_34136 [Lobosporangium transversale]|uniref:Uncharacterized protein n=1 Tax=Lobosporangium transversale TaxID=64571 RepID=A0A1Y2GR75_9FUNG|nr:hypothetical protein BCR41DRAFT_34136 [Lobosporangium transversale]ORZ20035.1 hypothetical protein BCR41DRAFT_34136 [Lobosporangium transversale]|eukprot:XP_021882575.1 hypothetical protein BCR41DRAFT_34136 [Lobosporangium transversale]